MDTLALHAFTMGDQRYGMQFDDYPEEEIDENEVSVLKAVGEHRRFFSYQYDFGDSWEHTVVVEEMTRTARGLKFAVCIDGQNASRAATVSDLRRERRG